MTKSLKTWIIIIVSVLALLFVSGGLASLSTPGNSDEPPIVEDPPVVEDPPASYDVEITLDQEHIIF